MTDNIGNQWAYLTEYSISNVLAERPGGNKHAILEFTGQAPATPEIINAIRGWSKRGGRLPVYSHEWMCLYCGTPQPLPQINCSQCGAPRSWFIG